MAKTYTEITDEITALDCPITKAKIQILYQDILDFANENLIGSFDIQDIDGINTIVNNPTGIISSVQTISSSITTSILVNLNITLTNYQPYISIQWLGGDVDPKIFNPVIFEKNSNNFKIGIEEGVSSNQNIRVHIKIQKI